MNKHGIKKFEEIPTKTEPQFLIDENGEPVVVATNPDIHGKTRTLTTERIPYSFDGHTYGLGLSGAAKNLSRDAVHH